MIIFFYPFIFDCSAVDGSEAFRKSFRRNFIEDKSTIDEIEVFIQILPTHYVYVSEYLVHEETSEKEIC